MSLAKCIGFTALSFTIFAIGCAGSSVPTRSSNASTGKSVDITKGSFSLVVDGEPTARIVLPAKTEFDIWTAEKPAWLEAELKQRNSHLDEKELDKLLKHQQRGLERSIERVGDEEVKAAEELQSIIAKITGSTLPIDRTDDTTESGNDRIYLGAAYARALGLGDELDKLDEDGFLCRVVDGKLVLAGRRARGTLYAVYDFLETLGCRWVMPSEFGELYPSSKTVRTSIKLSENPGHSQRYWWCTYGHGDKYPEWTLRNKGNFVQALGDPMVRQGHNLGNPLKWGAKQEDLRVKQVRPVRKRIKGDDGKVTIKWEDEEIWTLPDEYFAMTDGKLNFHTPNFANPKTWDLYARFFVDYFNRNPMEKYASMSAEDGFVKDERPASMKLRSKDYDFAMGAFSVTDPLWFFLNRVIERVEKVYPEKKFGILVYSNNLMPPRIEQMHKNMAIVFAPLGVSPLHHIRDEKSKTMRWYKEWFEDWMILAESAGSESYLYDYEPTGYCWNMALICPRWGIIGKNYPWFKEKGLDGHTTQGHDDWASCGLDNYLMQQLYWDPTLDYHDVIADYCDARFGAASAIMQQYYRVLEDRMAEIPDMYSNEVWDNHLILTPEVRKQCRQLLTKAVATAITERSKAQLQTMVDLQASTDAVCDGIEHMRETGDFGKAAKIMAGWMPVREKLNKIYSHFMLPTRTDPEKKAGFMTGGIYNQYLDSDKKIDEAKASVILPRYVKGGLDTRNHAAALGYHKPDADVSKLETLDTTVCPDIRYNTQREVAAFFYRTEVDVPKDFSKSDKHTLYFPAIIARGLQIWINGKPITFDMQTYTDQTWRGPDYFWMNYNHAQSYDISGYLEPGKKNTIAYRVFKSHDFGGTYRRVFLLAE